MKANASLGWHGNPGCVPASSNVPTGHTELVGGHMDASSLDQVQMAPDHTCDPVVRITSTSQTRSTTEASWTPLTKSRRSRPPRVRKPTRRRSTSSRTWSMKRRN